MTENQSAINILVEKIVSAIDTKLEKIPYDRTFPSIVQGKDGDKYKIPYEGRLRTVTSALSEPLEVGQWVWVKIPQGKLREMHICGVRR